MRNAITYHDNEVVLMLRGMFPYDLDHLRADQIIDRWQVFACSNDFDCWEDDPSIFIREYVED